MKSNVFFLVMIVAAGACAVAVGTEHVDASVKIAPIGDSITRGGMTPDSPYPSYRYHLWSTLRGAGYDVDFVGSTAEPGFQNVAFDQDHDGYSGYTTGLLADDMERMLQFYSPDVVLLHIGTNDVLHPVPVDERIRNVDRIVASLRQKNPNVRILLALISPTGDEFRNANSGLYEYNDGLAAYARRATSAASPIVTVDMASAWSAAQFDQEDGVHPNTDGETEQARRWADALVSTGILVPAPASPVTTIAPTTVVTAAPAPGPGTISPAAPPTPSIFGPRRYVLRPGLSSAGAGSSGTRPSIDGSPAEGGSSSAPATPTAPPSRPFQRWYPGQRWAAGLR